MKLLSKQIIAVFILIICTQNISSCNLKEGEYINLGIQNDSLIIDIPKNKKGRYSSIYDDCRKHEKLLGLDSLQNGFDSLQIRIWFNSGMTYKNKMIILKKIETGWTGQLITWILDYGSEESPKQTIKNKEIENVSPKSGWNAYIDQLIKLNIMTLPDGSNIKGVESGGGDLYMTSFEIATKKMYRFYTYMESDGYNKRFKELEDIENIIRCTKNEIVH